MTLSIRNRIPAIVTAVSADEAVATVRARLSDGQTLTSCVTLDAVRELGVEEGSPVAFLMKATEVALATGEVSGLSIRNRLPGTVARLDLGTAMATVTVDTDSGHRIKAAITMDAVDDLALADGTRVTALIKSNEVALATD